VYAKGRALGPEALASWMAVFRARLPERRPLTIVDVGSGTGRFTPALADTFGGPVYGVEPSAKMRAVAEAEVEAAHEGVTYLDGKAEQIPLPEASCDAGLVFFVWHHVDDRPRAARELARVIRPGGRLLVRTAFSDRMPELWWYRYLPRARDVDQAAYEPFALVVDTFTGAGWELVEHTQVKPEEGRTRRADFERLQLKALSTFEHLSDEEVEAGFSAIAAALADDSASQPVDTADDVLADLLVFRNSGT
jgi:ubiquinone/menaquinone biosynthesis C-methylase UbiE